MTDPTVPPNVVRCLCAVTAVGRAHGTEPACAEHGTGVVAELARLRGVVQELNAHDLHETLRKYRRLGRQYGIASATIAALRGQLARAREGLAFERGLRAVGLGDLPPRPATGRTMVVCGAGCTEPDCHDDGDRWVCTLPPHTGDDHEGIVVGGWHSWTTRGQHETRPTGPGATFDDRVTVPRPVEPTIDPYRSTHFRPYR